MKKISKRKKTFLIAEAGINHSGSIEDAKKLILLAKRFNFDAVKFQKRDLDICIPEAQKNIVKEIEQWEMVNGECKRRKTQICAIGKWVVVVVVVVAVGKVASGKRKERKKHSTGSK